jgi:hypothetical protein
MVSGMYHYGVNVGTRYRQKRTYSKNIIINNNNILLG